MEQKRLCPFCIGELPPAATVCPHCGKILEGCNPAGCLPVGTVLAGRYTVGEMRSLDGEGVLYSGVENLGAFRVTIKEYLPVTLSAERGADCVLRPKTGERGAVQDHPHGLCRPVPRHPAHYPRQRSGSRAGRGGSQQHRVCGAGKPRRHPAGAVAGKPSCPGAGRGGLRHAAPGV